MKAIAPCALLLIACNAEVPVRTGSHLEWQPYPAGTVTRIALGSCAFQCDEQAIWDAVIAADPDLYLSLGDAIYGDFDGRTSGATIPSNAAGCSISSMTRTPQASCSSAGTCTIPRSHEPTRARTRWWTSPPAA